MSEDERGRSSYLDLLVSTLMEHEKNLDTLIGKLEMIYEKLTTQKEVSPEEKIVAPIKKAEESARGQDSIVYMRIKLDRSIEEILKIIESLKE